MEGEQGMSNRYDDRDYGFSGEEGRRRYGRSGRGREGEHERYRSPDYERGRDEDYGYGRQGSDRPYLGGTNQEEYDREYPRERSYGGGYSGRGFSGGGYGRERSFREGSYGPGYGRRGEEYQRDRFSEPTGRSSERFNYPSGYRSGELYGSRYGRESEFDQYESGQRGGERGWWDRATDEVSSWFGDEEAERRRLQDQRRAQHRGRGPRGYQRSDDRIREDINDRLTDDPYLDASDIDVSVVSCEVTLTGNVSTREDKRRAEDLTEGVSGVRNVENRLRVNPQFGRTTTTESTGMSGTAGTSAASAGSAASGASAGRSRGTTA